MTKHLPKIALALSIISWMMVYFVFTGLEVVAIVLGFVSLKKFPKENKKPRRLAIAAIILGFLKPVSFFVFLFLRFATDIAH
jgi:hypothetical protein